MNAFSGLQVAAHKLASVGGPLQLAAALSWLHRAMLVEAMAVFPLLLWVSTHCRGSLPCTACRPPCCQ
jgi:hypothetical protein